MGRINKRTADEFTKSVDEISEIEGENNV